MYKLSAKNNHLHALCALSDTPETVKPDSLTKFIQNAPDPQTALQAILSSIRSPSDTLTSKWGQTVRQIWAAANPHHIEELLTLPLTAEDISQAKAVNEANLYLQIVEAKPLRMTQEEGEWLITPQDVYTLATRLPQLHNQPILQAENEWQYMPLHRLRRNLQSLKLVRRLKNELVIVKSRYQRFQQLPAVHQYYLLWHTDTYHVDWADYAGAWKDYIQTIQEYLPIIWNISQKKEPDYKTDIRQWNKEVLENFYPIWQQEGLINHDPPHTALLSMIRFQSLPTAVTQIILRDLFARYGMIYGQEDSFAYTNAGHKILVAENNEDLPCNLDLLP